MLRERRSLSRARVLAAQLRSPLLLLLVFAALASAATSQWIDATIVMAIVATTAAIGYSREYNAHAAAEALSRRLHARVEVIRDGKPSPLSIEEVVPGDVVLLAAGCLVPGDGSVLEAADFFVSEAALTGESFPVERRAGDPVLLGTNVRSGTARCVVRHTGMSTEFGAIAHRLTVRPPETEFERGIRRFGSMLVITMLVMVMIVFVTHVIRGRPAIETLLFSVALAVGLSPELLPAILTVNLGRGAQMMAERGVLVRRLNAIENLGSMDVLCTDKTGTLTEGVVRLHGAFDPDGRDSREVLRLAGWNAALATGLPNPLDIAVLESGGSDLRGIEKVAELPFDAIRKRVGVVIDGPDGRVLIVKGAFRTVIEVCTRVGAGSLDDETMRRLEARYATWGAEGIRVVAVATRRVEYRPAYDRGDERELTFLGFLTFSDRPKEGTREAIAGLAALAVSVKLITGDSKPVAEHVCRAVGLPVHGIMTGGELRNTDQEALWRLAEQVDVFAEVDPAQKERIILALKKTGHVVGFLGDGVNDAPAMHAADTSLSVADAVDVARQAADFVLLERGLTVIQRGVEEGRRTFANTMKYVLITTSANLGNMVSMAAASLMLPFLPLLASQILLNNFLSDIPAIGLADDRVDPEMVARPRRWDISFIARYMVRFGLISSAFDCLTFAVLIWVFAASIPAFRTAWFVESLLTELVVALVVRTSRPFYRSRPGALLLASTLVIVVVALATPFLPFAGLFGFVPVRPSLVIVLVLITALYIMTVEIAKQRVGGVRATPTRAEGGR